jgi:uncharacterized tellurite resistance protein B-like protein
MAKDFTKYSVEGIDKGLGKARLVQKVVEHYVSQMDMNFEELKEQWWDNIQGGKGIIRMIADIDASNERNYYIDAPIKLKDGTKIAVCNQWGKENFSNFILHAGLLGYVIKAEGDQPEKIVTEDTTSSDNNDSWTIFEPTWELPHAIAYLIRHMMVVDGNVEEGELNWMQAAFKEYEKYGIDVYNAWDEVDDNAQIYETMGLNDKLVVDSINYINLKLDDEQKSWLINGLMQIAAQDDLISTDEFVTLKIVANTFFPGQEGLVKDTFDRAGITIQE